MESFRSALSYLSDQAMFLSFQEAVERRKVKPSQELSDLCKNLRGRLGDRLSVLIQAGITKESFQMAKADLVESMSGYNTELLSSYDLEGADECEALQRTLHDLSLQPALTPSDHTTVRFE